MFSHTDRMKPGVLAQKRNQSWVMYEYAIHPPQFPVMKAHGVGFKQPKDPRCRHIFIVSTGAEYMKSDVTIPRDGHTYDKIINSILGIAYSVF